MIADNYARKWARLPFKDMNLNYLSVRCLPFALAHLLHRTLVVLVCFNGSQKHARVAPIALMTLCNPILCLL